MCSYLKISAIVRRILPLSAVLFCARKVTFCCGNRRAGAVSNGTCHCTGKKGSTHYAGCPCRRKGITRHRFLLSELHVGRCNVVARRDAWPFVRKVSSVSGRDRFIVPDGFIPECDEHVQFWSPLSSSSSSSWHGHGRTPHVTEMHAHAYAYDHQYARRNFHFHSRRVSSDIKALNPFISRLDSIYSPEIVRTVINWCHRVRSRVRRKSISIASVDNWTFPFCNRYREI